LDRVCWIFGVGDSIFASKMRRVLGAPQPLKRSGTKSPDPQPPEPEPYKGRRSWLDLPPKTCRQCGSVFAPTYGHQVVCSQGCRFDECQAKLKGATPRTCKGCGAVFESTAPRQWCDSICTSRFYRLRRELIAAYAGAWAHD
jgi:hypothetical protein